MLKRVLLQALLLAGIGVNVAFLLINLKPDRPHLKKRAQVDILGYLSPAIEDAYLHWMEYRKEIEKALKEANGAGLPKDYQLERSPESWDSFDLFVAAWTWAHHPARWAEPVAANVPPGSDLPPPIARPRLAFPNVPAGVSLELDPKTGQPARKGKSFSFDEIHMWALPKNSPDPRLSWQLARFLTQRGLQLREAEAQGMLPIRKDLRLSYPV